MSCARCKNPLRGNSYSLHFKGVLKYLDVSENRERWETLGEIKDLCYSCYNLLKNKLRTFKKDNWL